MTSAMSSGTAPGSGRSVPVSASAEDNFCAGVWAPEVTNREAWAALRRPFLPGREPRSFGGNAPRRGRATGQCTAHQACQTRTGLRSDGKPPLLAGPIEVEAIEGRNVDEVGRRQTLVMLSLQVVGGIVAARLSRRREERAGLRIVAAVRRNWSIRNGWVVPPLRRLPVLQSH